MFFWAFNKFMNEKNRLENELKKFDGVAVSLLSEARIKCRDTPDYFDELIRLSFDPRETISAGATWIIKAELEEGGTLKLNQIEKIVALLNNEMPWQSMLHICQSIEWIPLTQEQANRFFQWSQSLTNHSRPFLRVWSLHVLVIIGSKYKTFQEEAIKALKNAHDDKAASVRARARKLQKLLN